MQTFRSVKNISEASEEELAKQVGKAKAKLVYEHFRS